MGAAELLWAGQMGGDRPFYPKGRAIDALNRKLPNDPRVETMLLAIVDGILICRKR